MPVQVLVVDGANVVGSRPDGWWHDRAGAAHRLRDQLAAAELPYDEVVLVLEGAARGGPTEGTADHSPDPKEDRRPRLRTVHAPGSGDDAIVDTVLAHLAGEEAQEVVVVTADRGLRSRVEAAGARTVGPAWLLDRLG